MFTPQAGFVATYCGEPGTITRVHGKSFYTPLRNVWWQGTAEEHMFSLRADGCWRMFPGPADGPGLKFS